MQASLPFSPWCWRGAARVAATRVALAAALIGAPTAAWAGAVTASSVWDQNNALERAREQIPAGATVTREHCVTVEVGINNPRYRCTVWFEPADPRP